MGFERIMSGGHFDYHQFRMREIAEEIEKIAKSGTFREDVLNRFSEAAHTVNQAADMVQRVDWLLCYDDGEDSFIRRWEEEVREYWNEKNR